MFFIYNTSHVPNLYEFLSSAEHKIRYFKECSVVLKMKVLCDWVSERTG